METPLSPNWPLAWVSAFNLLVSPVQSFLLPRFPLAWRYTVAGLFCYAFALFAAWQTALTGPEVLLQGGVLLGMAFGGYAAARSGVGLVAGFGAAAAGLVTTGAVALILPAFAQDPTAAAGIADTAKDAAKAQVSWWIAWAFSVLGGWLGRKLDGKPITGARSPQPAR